jgi:hypothetical protein
MRRRRRIGRLSRRALLVLALVVVLPATSVLGYWSISGSGSASASVGGLAVPTNVTVSSITGTGVVSVGWTGVTAPAGGAVTGYYVERLSGSTAAFACGSSLSSLLPATPTTCSDTGVAAGTYTYRVTAVFRSWTATSAASGSVTVVTDVTPPTVVSITRLDPTPTAAASVRWAVTFSEPVTGVNTSDFALVQAGGVSGATLSGVTGSDSSYVVTAGTGTGNGTLRLNLVDNDSIVDAAGYRLGGTGTSGAGNGSFTGELYAIDRSPPAVPLLTLSGATGNTYVTGLVVFVNPQVGRSGGFTVGATSSDAQSGIASITFPILTGFTSGGGADPTSPYSTTYAWSDAAAAGAAGARTVTATNGAGLTSSATFTVVADTTTPTGGALSANGGAAYNTTGTVAVTRTNYVETPSSSASGLASSTLTRETATLSGNVCGVFGGATTVTITGGNDSQSLATGCYRYVLTGTDNVGNAATIVSQTIMVDRTPPAAPVLSFSALTGGTYYPGTGATLFFRPSVPGGFTLTATAADADTGIAGYTFPSPLAAGWTTAGSGADRTYTFAAGAAPPGARPVTATNGAGIASSAATFTVAADTIAPTGGALTVNGTAATAGGTTSTSTGAGFAIARTDYAETASATQSGLASSTLTRQQATLTGATCGTFGPATVLTGSPMQTGLDTGCYRYILTGMDNLGNAVSVMTTVRYTLAPTVIGMQLLNGGGTPGRPDQDDRIVIQFSKQMSVSSFCSAWSDDAADQTLSGDNDVTVRIGTNDQLTVTSTSCAFNFGSIALGANYVLIINTTFGGSGADRSTIDWDASERTLTIVLGERSTYPLLSNPTSIATYSPSAGITDSAGAPLAGGFTTANVQQF